MIDVHGVRFYVYVHIVGNTGTATVRTGWIYRPHFESPDLTSARVRR
jgi:hypothetical protein